MNSDEVWLLQLWSGAIGSFVAAILGGLVALIVVRLTNRQQRRNAIEVREIDAVAEFLSTVESVIRTFTNLEKYQPNETSVDLSRALLKLHLAGPGLRELAAALDYWPTSITNLCISYHLAVVREVKLPINVRKVMSDVSVEATVGLRHWFDDSRAAKAQHLVMVHRLTEEMRQTILRIDDALDAQEAANLKAANPAN